MKNNFKKIILLITTILTTIIDLSYAINIYKGIINLESFGDIVNITNNSQIVILLFCSVINIVSIFLIFSSNQSLSVHKKKLIFLYIIQLLLGNIFNIISGIINIFLLSYKAKDMQEKSKKEIPILEDITKYKWYVYFIIFLFLFIICYTPISNLLPDSKSKFESILRIVTLYIIQLTLLIIPMFNELKRDFIVFKNNFKQYLSNMLPRFGIIIIVYMISNLFVMYFISNIPTNQAIINTWPIYITAIIAIIIAPLTEELMFRGFMKKFIKNDILFIIISSLIFGGLHVAVSTNLKEMLFIIPYSVLGFAFSLNYVKTKNIASNIFLHSSWNSLAVLAMIFLKLTV